MSALKEILKRRDPIKTAIVKKKMFFAKKLHDKITKEELKKKLEYDKDKVDLFLSGTYDFRLSDIAVLEQKLNIKLFEL